MQSKGSALLFLVILAFPIIALSADHDRFFLEMAVLVTLSSVKSIFSLVVLKGFEKPEPDEELEEELEELVGIDIRKFGDGLSVAVNMVIIVFILYCAFFLETFLLKCIAALAIVFQVHFMIRKLQKGSGGFDKNKYKPQVFFSSVTNIAVVLLTILNKLSRLG